VISRGPADDDICISFAGDFGEIQRRLFGPETECLPDQIMLDIAVNSAGTVDEVISDIDLGPF
jgi:hypothetical protein